MGQRHLDEVLDAVVVYFLYRVVECEMLHDRGAVDYRINVDIREHVDQIVVRDVCLNHLYLVYLGFVDASSEVVHEHGLEPVLCGLLLVTAYQTGHRTLAEVYDLL